MREPFRFLAPFVFILSGRPMLLMLVYDDAGELIERWQPTDEGEWQMLEELHSGARRKAMRTADRLKDLLDTLQTAFSSKKR